MNSHNNDKPQGVQYLVNFEGKLIDPKLAPEYWNSLGRFFVARSELNSLISNNENSTISIYNENDDSIQKLALFVDDEYPSGRNEIALGVDIPEYGKANWIATPINNSKNRMIEICPSNKIQLEILYKSKHIYFIGNNCEIT